MEFLCGKIQFFFLFGTEISFFEFNEEGFEEEREPMERMESAHDNHHGVHLPILPVVNSMTGMPVQISEIEDCDLENQEIVGMNRRNYSAVMGKILKREMYCRQLQLWRLNQTAALKLSSTYVIERNNASEMKICVPGELFATIDLESELVLSRISEETALGRLVLRSCREVIVTPSNNSGQRYLCPIVEKLNTSIVIIMGKTMVRDLDLKPAACLSFKIEMKLETKNFEDMGSGLRQLTVVESEFLFPDFSKGDVHFENDVSHYFDGCSSLNPGQLIAYAAITNPVYKTTAAVPPILLIGPFGTGKTHTLSLCVKKLLKANNNARVLICTHSNSAADIYITAIDEWANEGKDQTETNVPALRVYYKERHVSTVPIHVRKYCLLSPEGLKFRYPTKKELSRQKIVISTLSTSSELLKIGIGKGFFTHIIIDEAAQALETEAILPLLLADYKTRVILAGDHMQLSPELFSTKEDISVNILERLFCLYPPSHPCRVLLSDNYRSEENILKFASKHFYQNSLYCATKQPPHPCIFSLSFVHVSGEEGQGTTSYFNMEELSEVAARINQLVDSWPANWGEYDSPGGIAVLTSYADQVIRLRTYLRYKRLGYVTVDRVWNAQGKEFRAVLISTVRTLSAAVENEANLGFLSNPKLLNTALTRAQSLVMVIGHARSLCSVGKCQNIWADYIKTSFQNNGLQGINYRELKEALQWNQEAVLAQREGEQRVFERVPSSYQQVGQAVLQPGVSWHGYYDTPQPVYHHVQPNYCNNEGLGIRASQPVGPYSGFIPPISAQDEVIRSLEADFGRMLSSGLTCPSASNAANNGFHTQSNPPEASYSHQTGFTGAPATPYMSYVSYTLENAYFPQLQGPEGQQASSAEWVRPKYESEQVRPGPANRSKGPQQSKEKSADEKIGILCRMGFGKRRCIRALQFAGMDLDKALEILVSGQPKPRTANAVP